MFERFSERARQVVVLAEAEARTLGHDSIRPEHLLLGLLREDGGVAARVLRNLDVTADDVRAELLSIQGEGDAARTGRIAISPRANETLELALREALSRGAAYVDTEHLLLALVRQEEEAAARILLDAGADAETVRAEVVRTLTWSSPWVERASSDVTRGIVEPRRRRRVVSDGGDYAR